VQNVYVKEGGAYSNHHHLRVFTWRSWVEMLRNSHCIRPGLKPRFFYMKDLPKLHSLPIISFMGFRLFLLRVLSKFIIKSLTVYVRACVYLRNMCVRVKARQSSTSGSCSSRPGRLRPTIKTRHDIPGMIEQSWSCKYLRIDWWNFRYSVQVTYEINDNE
jgi:hypothetical protein